MLKIDMHVHTTYSIRDGLATPKEMIKAAEKRGLDGIAITDHDTMSGLKEALEVKTNITIIPGCEISAMEGHILAYGLSEGIPKGMPAAATIKLIHKKGGIAVAAHPLDIFRKGIGAMAFELPFDAVESFNGHNYFWNRKTQKMCLERKIPQVGGSDAHMAKEVGLCYTLFEQVDNYKKDIGFNKTMVAGTVVPIFTVVEKWMRTHILHEGMRK
ncbi:MAG: PHP domain-containing protein [Candidatus Methanofastidiosia archaeon]